MTAKTAIALLSVALPWPVRRLVLRRLCGYKIAAGARIGLSLVAVDELEMEAGSFIGHLNVIKGVTRVKLGESSKIGSLNWVSGIGERNDKHFSDEPGRRSQLVMGRYASITGRHSLDCSNSVEIGEFTTIAGAGTQILTHAIDVVEGRQRSAPVRVGPYCFVGTACVLLKGSALPDHAVLGALSMLRKAETEPYKIYSGVPAVAVAPLPETAAYFTRTTGYVP